MATNTTAASSAHKIAPTQVMLFHERRSAYPSIYRDGTELLHTVGGINQLLNFHYDRILAIQALKEDQPSLAESYDVILLQSAHEIIKLTQDVEKSVSPYKETLSAERARLENLIDFCEKEPSDPKKTVTIADLEPYSDNSLSLLKKESASVHEYCKRILGTLYEYRADYATLEKRVSVLMGADKTVKGYELCGPRALLVSQPILKEATAKASAPKETPAEAAVTSSWSFNPLSLITSFPWGAASVPAEELSKEAAKAAQEAESAKRAEEELLARVDAVTVDDGVAPLAYDDYIASICQASLLSFDVKIFLSNVNASKEVTLEQTLAVLGLLVKNIQANCASSITIGNIRTNLPEDIQKGSDSGTFNSHILFLFGKNTSALVIHSALEALCTNNFSGYASNSTDPKKLELLERLAGFAYFVSISQVDRGVMSEPDALLQGHAAHLKKVCKRAIADIDNFIVNINAGRDVPPADMTAVLDALTNSIHAKCKQYTTIGIIRNGLPDSVKEGDALVKFNAHAHFLFGEGNSKLNARDSLTTLRGNEFTGYTANLVDAKKLELLRHLTAFAHYTSQSNIPGK